MIVYGDPKFRAPGGEVVRWLRPRLLQARAGDLQTWRALLIQAGQLEQALADALGSDSVADCQSLVCCQALSDHLAKSFVRLLEQGRIRRVDIQEFRQAAIEALDHAAQADGWPEGELTLKVPEGFEFYTLFPEQYRLSTLNWLAAQGQGTPEAVLVLGVRGIGTTLSAVVAATLEAAGWPNRRLTVRPTGHPFERRVSVDPALRGSAQRALIVDEGPGISGSSMAAVAAALRSCGFARGAISFLPGHGGSPGSAASEEVRECWASTPRYTVRLDQLRWRGRGLADCLACETERLQRVSVQKVQHIGAGAWRELAYAHEKEWPAVTTRFERSKYLVACADGFRVLWKSIGLGAWIAPDRTAAEAIHVAQKGPVPEPLACCHGFVAFPWIEGERLTRAEAADPAVLRHLAAYVIGVAGPPLAPTAQQCAQQRLLEMMQQNIREALGETALNGIHRAAAALHNDAAAASYGDGRMAPHEWIRTPSGQLIKTDSFGHTVDHTIVGRQSILWDVAGAIVEWDLDHAAGHRWRLALANAGLHVDPQALCFYQMAYAAFRLGIVTLCLELEGTGSLEHPRLVRVRQKYLERVRSSLGVSG